VRKVFFFDDALGIVHNFDVQLVSTTYGSISRTVHNLSDIPPFPSISTIVLNFPTTQSKIIQEFKSHLRAHPASPNKKRVVIIDSIISNPGVLLPWKEMVQICKDEDV
jgi:hercynylcysteine S-oxide lyase